MRDVSVDLPRPHIKQLEFIQSPAKRKIIRAGRRSGKTFGIAIYAVVQFLQGKRVLYATPTTDQHERFWLLIKAFLAEPLIHKMLIKNENTHQIKSKNSAGRIKCKTAWSADTLRGDFADVLILDEFQMMNEDTWAVVGAPMMLDTNGDAVFIYTPPSPQSASVSKAKDKRHASKLFKRAEEDTTGRWATFTFSSHENPHLSTEALEEITSDMSDFAYKQEILALDLDEVPGALWTRKLISETRVKALPDDIALIVVGVDPKVTERRGSSETGIIVSALGSDGHVYVFADESNNGSPDEWAKKVVFAHEHYAANRIVAEVNQGGGLVKTIIRQYSKTAQIHLVHASKGKQLRAEPIATMFEQGKAHIVGDLSILEDQMTSFVPGDRVSPDRLDAMVWSISSILTSKRRVLDASKKYDWVA
jgi:hypothetical protein